jgi:hypothetical protein
MLVAGLGDLAVFPCNSAKRPLVKAWPEAARRVEPAEHWPRVGTPMGSINDIDAVDVDPQGLNWYRLNFDALPKTRVHLKYLSRTFSYFYL